MALELDHVECSLRASGRGRSVSHAYMARAKHTHQHKQHSPAASPISDRRRSSAKRAVRTCCVRVALAASSSTGDCSGRRESPTRSPCLQTCISACENKRVARMVGWGMGEGVVCTAGGCGCG
jgi:hypothetical protein